MDSLPEVMPKLRDGVMVADYDTEVVVLVASERTTHHLDVGLSLVVDSCDGSTAVDVVISEISGGTNASEAETRGWLLDALTQLERLEIV